MSSSYSIELDSTLTPAPVSAALIWGAGIAPPQPTEKPPAFLSAVLAEAERAGVTFVSEEIRSRVRNMLRFGKYRPSGRGKPASEFLLRAAVERAFPLINGPVDVNNAISLESGFPGSLFDGEVSGRSLLLRRGRAGEAYVFNPSGQTIDLEDLLLVCRETDSGWEPCGNPVKDSMKTKICETTRVVVAVLYSPPDEPIGQVETWASRYAELLAGHCEAEETGFVIAA